MFVNIFQDNRFLGMKWSIFEGGGDFFRAAGKKQSANLEKRCLLQKESSTALAFSVAKSWSKYPVSFVNMSSEEKSHTVISVN